MGGDGASEVAVVNRWSCDWETRIGTCVWVIKSKGLTLEGCNFSCLSCIVFSIVLVDSTMFVLCWVGLFGDEVPDLWSGLFLLNVVPKS